tara:strand:- start:764 stop:1018 length:255 start_codon:yes stop_codon:yes gene_type:complete
MSKKAPIRKPKREWAIPSIGDILIDRNKGINSDIYDGIIISQSMRTEIYGEDRWEVLWIESSEKTWETQDSIKAKYRLLILESQ